MTIQIATQDTDNLIKLPIDGFSRANDILPFLPFLPFGNSTLWAWSKTGKFPKPIKINNSITAWKNADVHDWFKQIEDKNR